MRPDGKRALTSFFQTGNFGVLDRDLQQRFTTVPHPVERMIAEPGDELWAFVGVTPAILLNEQVWPRRGAFDSFGGAFTVPSPDDRLKPVAVVVWAINAIITA